MMNKPKLLVSLMAWMLMLSIAAYGHAGIEIVPNPTAGDPEAEAQTTALLFDLSSASAGNVRALLSSTDILDPALDMIRRLRRNDVLLVVDVPLDAPAALADAADATLSAGLPALGATILEACTAREITLLVHCAYPRYMATEQAIALHAALQSGARDAGIAFLDVAMPDPAGGGGKEAYQRFILEYMTEQMAHLPEERIAFCVPYAAP